MSVDVFEKKSVTKAAADALVQAAVAKAAELELAVTIAVVDESGTLKALARMDGAPVPTVAVAQAKARTAAQWGAPTGLWRTLGKDDPGLLIGFVGALGEVGIFGGASPVKSDGAVVGGVASSGGSEDQDAEIVQAALVAVGADAE
jgi:uncharacterized protein GlcG (DUF336 family)